MPNVDKDWKQKKFSYTADVYAALENYLTISANAEQCSVTWQFHSH